MRAGTAELSLRKYYGPVWIDWAGHLPTRAGMSLELLKSKEIQRSILVTHLQVCSFAQGSMKGTQQEVKYQPFIPTDFPIGGEDMRIEQMTNTLNTHIYHISCSPLDHPNALRTHETVAPGAGAVLRPARVFAVPTGVHSTPAASAVVPVASVGTRVV